MTPMLDIPVIRSERLVLRGLRAADFPAYAAYYTDPARTTGVGGPLSTDRVFERFASMIGHWAMRGFGRYAITTGGAAFGHVGLSQPGDDAPEMTWTLWDAGQTGKGFATEAARAVLQQAFAEGRDSIPAHVHPSNHASIAVAKRLGGVPDSATAPPAYAAGMLRFRLTKAALAGGLAEAISGASLGATPGAIAGAPGARDGVLT